MNPYYVYIYKDPRKEPPEPIYVGKGHNDRFKHHLTKKVKNQLFSRKLNKIKEAGLTPIIEFVQKDITNEEAILLEINLIKQYGRLNKRTGTLCNLTDGGEGTDGYQHSETTKKLFSAQRKGKKQTEKQYQANCSRIVSEETRKKISESLTGHKLTPQHIEKLIQCNKNKVMSDESRAKMSKIRLNHTPTKANYPPIEELITMIQNSSIRKIAKSLGINNTSLSNYLKRRNIKVKDARFKPNQ